MTVIPFPLAARADLVRSVVDDLHQVHGAEANEFWRRRIAEIVAGLRDAGHSQDTIRHEIYELQYAVQNELQMRSGDQRDAAG